MITELRKEIEDLKTELSQTSDNYDQLRKKYHNLELEKRFLQQKIDALLRRIYGKRSEKYPSGQLDLPFDELIEEAEEEIKREETAAKIEEIEETPKKKKSNRNGRKPLPQDLPRMREEIYPDPEDQICKRCNEQMESIGEEITEELDIVPAKLFIREIVRKKFACKSCQEGVVTPSLPPRPIEKGRPGVGLLAHVAVSKYSDHIPLHRQQIIFARHGLEIRRSTLCDWLGKIALLLEPIVKEMKRYIFTSPVVQSDDTYVQVKDKKVKGKNRRGFLWVYCIPWAEVVYDFTLNRSRDGPLKFIDGYEGYLQTDGYGGYNELFRRGKITHIACGSHIRRKFHEAKEEAPEKANIIIAYIQALYRIEREAKDLGLDAAAKVKLRQEKAKPIIIEIEKLIREFGKKALPKSNLGKAIQYALGQWKSFVRYLDVGEAELDNNSCEQAMRNVVIGRRNWVHFGNAEGGALRATVFYSLIESCKRLKIEPFTYLKDVIERVSIHPASEIWDLTPRGWKEKFGKQHAK